LTANSKNALLVCLRRFFSDCQEWGWIPRRFNPVRYLRTPRTIMALLQPDPRIIADDVWAKLLWAGLNLTEDDIPKSRFVPGDAGSDYRRRAPSYPLEMYRAIAIVWLFAALRNNEIRRLRVGCIRWQSLPDASPTEETPDAPQTPQPTICLLEVPMNKTSGPFVKPVNHVVGEAIESWQRHRPPQAPSLDRKTGERVDYLFSQRGWLISDEFINKRVIPILCRKANVPRQDARGNITSHRARSTIASQLLNSREPMTIYELKEWLGHRCVKSTQQYVKTSPLRLTRAYADADYLERNLRTIQVLIDQEAVKNGDAARGLPWQYYDLGHGYCTYDFFDQCPHRMVCAKCSFYVPKGSSKAQLLESKANLQRMLQAIPLLEDERAAVEDGLEAVEKLLTRLADIPTPAGPTPRELGQARPALAIIPLEASHVSGAVKDIDTASECAQEPFPVEREAENGERSPAEALVSARSSRPRAKRAATKQVASVHPAVSSS
jgi:integrase